MRTGGGKVGVGAGEGKAACSSSGGITGCHCGLRSFPVVVSGMAVSVPGDRTAFSTFITWMLSHVPLPEWETNAIHLPSGDQRGAMEFAERSEERRVGKE